MAHFNVLWDGAEVPPSGSPAPAPNTYEISAIPAPVPDPDFPLSMQWQADGVDLGEPNVRIINFIAALDEFLVTRGTGEQSNVITVRKLTVPPPPPPSDVCYDEVILLMQRGVLVDTSSYARPVSAIGGGVTTLVAEPEAPGGLMVRVNGAHNATGIDTGTTTDPEWDMGTLPRNFRGFVKVAAGALAGGSQILFNDGFGFNGMVFGIAITSGRQFLRWNSTGFTFTAPVTTPAVVENEVWYIETQVYTDRSIRSWAGKVSTGVATGGEAWSATVAADIVPPDQGPYVGYVGGSGGVNNFQFEPWEVTACERQPADTTSIVIPTDLFPEIGP